MSKPRQTILASRPAALILALSLVAGLSAPFLMLPKARAAATPVACAENNQNGCTELSPTPPQDTVAVPPNIVLMLDDSGSMNWDVMPDYGFLSDKSQEGLIDSDVNGVYYNPTVTYSLPPMADGSSFPAASFSAALVNGFDSTSATVDLSTYRGKYDSYDVNYFGTGVQYSISVADVGATTYEPSSSCPAGTESSGSAHPGYCYYDSHSKIPSGPVSFFDTGNRYFYVSRCNSTQDVYTYAKTDDYCTPGHSFFTYTTSNVGGGYTRFYVAENTGDCAAVGLSSDVCDESAAAQQNVANWFSYYHTRILMAKSGLMTAFDKLSPNYRFGFGSINNNNYRYITDNLSYTTQNGKYIAQVAPFGSGVDTDGNPITDNQRYYFWKWLEGESAGSSTPLRLSLQAVGKYYQTSQPWNAMAGDPGYTGGTKPIYACRASYTILTTDGFWNGNPPTNPATTGAADKNGLTYSPPAGKTYTVTGYVATPPFSGGEATSDGKAVPSLADVATYYWENDLQPDPGGIPNELAPSKDDPAFWQHMTTFTMGLGFLPTGIQGTAPNGDNPPTIQDIFNWANDGGGSGSAYAITGFSWPTPSPDNQGSEYNVADLAHAAVNGHGDFFSAKNPQDLAAGFAKAISEISSRTVAPTPASVNASVTTTGALSFSTGYSTQDWSGQFQAMTLNEDGTVDTANPVWDAAAQLDAAYHSANYTKRTVYTDAYTSTATPAFSSFQFTAANAGSLDATETAGLMSPASSGATDTAKARINYLLGDPSNEGTLSTQYRTRATLLGAIIRSQPVYVAYPSGNYYDSWPAGSPEIATGAESYDTFVSDNADRAGTVYVGANDGMLHAFDAALKCNATDPVTGKCTSYGPDQETGAGAERWAFIPRAVYANLGNLIAQDFSYRPTVDETPVTRDVFFSDQKWHTMLAGGVGLGGRGVYALDITDPTSFSASNVLWEFDSDMTVDSGCETNDGTACRGTDLGYTVSQPNIGRIAYNKGTWVVLVPNGYFPDCTTPDTPTNDTTNCQAIAAQAPKDSSGNPYSALFVLDAQTGKMIAELKTPDISGVTSFGLATPVMGDYNNDQVDDVAFAGDVEGNLWRFDLTGAGPSAWAVTLVYKAPTQGAQPITTMPRLFPDPSTNRFMVVFGTGKFLGVGDNSSTTVQALMGVRDVAGTTYTQTDLTQQYLHETTETMPDGTIATLRCVTGGAADTCATGTGSGAATPVNAVPASSGGWFINLYTTAMGTQNDAGERVVVNPGAIFASNTVVFETLITGSQSSDPCSPSTQGAILALSATDGSPAGVSSLGGWPIAGGRINNARTSGSLPIVSALGGGQAYLPGTTLAPSGTQPISIDAPIWRRRSWNEINQSQ